jgi:peptidoglycan hydrolase-like protein with peptidoglycan-binding domain
LQDFKIREERPMRALILALSILGILVSADPAKAGLSTATRNPSASADPATVTDEATRQTEGQIRLDKAKRRAVQRRLTGLGFDTKINGKFDEPTRAAIARWQEARGYPATGFLNTLQHQALLTESVSEASANAGSDDKSVDDHVTRRRSGSRVHHHRGGGGPIRLIGGMVGGLFGH